MNLSQFRPLQHPLWVALAVASVLPSIAHAQASACVSAAPLTRLQQRLMTEAEQGNDALRRYVHRAGNPHQLDIYEVGDFVQRQRLKTARCMAEAPIDATVVR